MVLKFNVNGGISKAEVADDCYVDELFATLEDVSPSVSDDELHQMMRNSDAGIICEATGQNIQFRDHANGDQTITDIGLSPDVVYSFNKNAAGVHING